MPQSVNLNTCVKCFAPKSDPRRSAASPGEVCWVQTPLCTGTLGGTGGTGSWEGNGEIGLVRRPEVSFENFPIIRKTRPMTTTVVQYRCPAPFLLPAMNQAPFIHPSGSRSSAHPLSAPFILPGSPVNFGHTSQRVVQNGICTQVCWGEESTPGTLWYWSRTRCHRCRMTLRRGGRKPSWHSPPSEPRPAKVRRSYRAGALSGNVERA
jgi:hypothetical protein